MAAQPTLEDSPPDGRKSSIESLSYWVSDNAHIWAPSAPPLGQQCKPNWHLMAATNETINDNPFVADSNLSTKQELLSRLQDFARSAA